MHVYERHFHHRCEGLHLFGGYKIVQIGTTATYDTLTPPMCVDLRWKIRIEKFFVSTHACCELGTCVQRKCLHCNIYCTNQSNSQCITCITRKSCIWEATIQIRVDLRCKVESFGHIHAYQDEVSFIKYNSYC